MKKRAFLQAAPAALLLPGSLWAQDRPWTPQRNIRITVPYGAGGPSDVAARVVAHGVGNAFGQPMVVENKPGANGVLGASLTYRSAPDGTQLMVGATDTHIIYHHMYRNPAYDAPRFVAIAPIGKVPHVLLARQGLPVSTAREVIQLAQKQSLSYASWGPSSAGNLCMTAFRNSASIPDLLHVPFTGAAPAIQALMAGQVDLMMAPAPMALSMEDKARLICVYSNQPVPALPRTPTLQQSGVDLDVKAEFWMGFLAPPGTPDRIALELHRKITAAAHTPEVAQKLRQMGILPQTSSLAQYQNFYRNEFAVWQPIVKATGVLLD